MSAKGSTSFKAALVQLRSGRSVERNVSDALDLIARASSQGADYIQTPECTTLLELDPERLKAETFPEAGNPALAAFAEAARKHGVWLHIGSAAVKVDDGRLANRSYLFRPDGSVAASYDKIHMFDVDLGNGEVYRESANYRGGCEAIVTPLPWGGLGLTICYDLRFPALYRALAQNGAAFISVPAAFTRITGEAHWNTLLRARAIETQTFVLAANQGGRHENGRETYGHSLIISPWGEVLAEGDDSPGVIAAEIDPSVVLDVRRRVPSLEHDRTFSVAGDGAKVRSIA